MLLNHGTIYFMRGYQVMILSWVHQTRVIICNF